MHCADARSGGARLRYAVDVAILHCPARNRPLLASPGTAWAKPDLHLRVQGVDPLVAPQEHARARSGGDPERRCLEHRRSGLRAKNATPRNPTRATKASWTVTDSTAIHTN